MSGTAVAKRIPRSEMVMDCAVCSGDPGFFSTRKPKVP
jgi:hypothetical protein